MKFLLKLSIIFILLSLPVLNPTSSYGEHYIPYNIHKDLLAKNCEYYIKSFGDAHAASSLKRWLEAEIVIDPRLENSILKVGATVEYLVGVEKSRQVRFLTSQGAGRKFTQKISYFDNDKSDPNYFKIQNFNFYIDIQIERNTVHRYWLYKKPLTTENTFWGYPYIYLDRGVRGGIAYTQLPSPVLKQRKNCLGH